MNSNGKEEEMYLTQTVSSEIPFPVKAPAKGKGSASSTIRTAHGGEHIVASAGEKVIAESDSCVVATEGSQVVALSGSKVIFTPGSEVTIHFGSEVIDPFGMRVKPRAPASKAARAEITGILDAYAPAPDEKLSTNQTANAAQKKLDDAAEIKRLLSELSSLIAQQQARQFGEISKIVRSLQTITISTGPVKRSGAKPQRNVDRRKSCAANVLLINISYFVYFRHYAAKNKKWVRKENWRLSFRTQELRYSMIPICMKMKAWSKAISIK